VRRTRRRDKEDIILSTLKKNKEGGREGKILMRAERGKRKGACGKRRELSVADRSQRKRKKGRQRRGEGQKRFTLGRTESHEGEESEEGDHAVRHGTEERKSSAITGKRLAQER